MVHEMMEHVASAEIQTGETSIYARSYGSGPPILLLHGFPQTHLMWRGVAPLLARRFTVVCADLRGYGRSGCPDSAQDHAPYAKRSMARDMVEVMDQLGFPRFSVAGHDRGGRVAYRLALDRPERVDRLAVLAIVDDALDGWGSASTAFPPEVRAAYVQALRDPGHAHAICEEYRAAATIDREHDRADRRRGRRIRCPLLAIWGAQGPLDTWYAEEGGPLALWRAWADDVQGHAFDGGHFFPEEAPEQTADTLYRFFGSSARSG